VVEEHTRLQRARSFVTALAAGDIEASVALLAEDVEYHVEGANPFSGTFRGRSQVREHVAKLLHDASNEFVKIEDWLSSEERVAAIVRHRMDIAGRAAVGRRLLLFEFDADSKILMLTVFTDAQANFDAMIGADPAAPPDVASAEVRRPTISGASPPERAPKHPHRS
jgi:ketosteroid isomerase-like protein